MPTPRKPLPQLKLCSWCGKRPAGVTILIPENKCQVISRCGAAGPMDGTPVGAAERWNGMAK